MTTWEIKSLAGDLSKVQQRRIRWYNRALEKAAVSNVPKPKDSGYHVKAAIGPIKSHFLPGGNVEHGDHSGLHSEECSVGAYFSRTNGRLDAFGQPILALVAGTPGNPATPCGNCRDILLEVFGPELEIVSGAPEGGIAIVAPLSAYLSEHADPIKDIEQEMSDHAFRILEDGKSIEYDPYSSPESLAKTPHYYASITVCFQPTGFPKTQRARTGSLGAIYLDCEYHPVYPLLNAILGLVRRPMKRVCLRHIVVVSSGEEALPPHVFYRDRQHLLGYHLRCEAVLGEESDPPVYLFRVSDKKIVGAWETSVKQWLPHPFSPKNFGVEFMKHFCTYCRSKENP